MAPEGYKELVAAIGREQMLDAIARVLLMHDPYDDGEATDDVSPDTYDEALELARELLGGLQ